MSRATALTIGNFDGVHLGHQALVRAARKGVGAEGRVVALTFDPHPASVLRRGPLPGALSTPPLSTLTLSTLNQRRRWLLEAGADDVVVLRPTHALLEQSPEAFLTGMMEQWRPDQIVEGPDFRFGRGRAGTVETLRAAGRAMGFRTRIIDPVEASLIDSTRVLVSSSLVRWMLRHGRVGDARRLLGRPYQIDGQVKPGDRRGRELGVPTANIDHGAGLLPADGVYGGLAQGPDGRWYKAAISVGTKPTFGEHPRVCEVHLIGYQGSSESYGWTTSVHFLDWLRDQVLFEGVEPLVAQIRRDIEQAQGCRA